MARPHPRRAARRALVAHLHGDPLPPDWEAAAVSWHDHWLTEAACREVPFVGGWDLVQCEDEATLQAVVAAFEGWLGAVASSAGLERLSGARLRPTPTASPEHHHTLVRSAVVERYPVWWRAPAWNLVIASGYDLTWTVLAPAPGPWAALDELLASVGLHRLPSEGPSAP